MRNRQNRDKFFFVPNDLRSPIFSFKVYPYADREALGVNLLDGKYRNEPILRFTVRGEDYEIEREKAFYFGRKYKLNWGNMPHLIPKTEMKLIKKEAKEPQTRVYHQQTLFV